jgi:hypothetical protein
MRTSTLLLLASLLACGAAFAQVQSLQVRKIARYVQSDATTAVTRTSSHALDALVDGPNIGGIPAPTIGGPFNVGALGARHNNGVMVYNAPEGGWRWGTSANDYRAASQGELDGLFPNGTYTFNLAGASPVSLRLNGDVYPNAPQGTLEGGTWSDGKYLVDPSKGLTVTTNAYTGYGSHRNDTICIFLRGPGFTSPQATVPSCPGTLLVASTSPGRNVASLAIAPGSLLPDQEYTIVMSFSAIVDSVSGVSGLPGATGTARYISATIVRVKTTTPVFPMTVNTRIENGIANSTAQIQFRPQDLGTSQSVFVFAMAPKDLVKDAVLDKAAPMQWFFRKSEADLPVQCVLAQLSASGQLVGVSASTIQAYVTGVLSSQGAAVTIINGVPTVNIGGATFFVGYGTSAQSMLNGGINRSAVTIPGAQVCEPTAPQTGWWWNPLEDGRGFSVEKRGNNLFFASFLYDASGRSTWYVSSGPASLEGSLYAGDLLVASGGQTLGGAYPGFPTLTKVGTVTMTFNSATNGALVWPGGTVPIQRQPFVPNGLSLAAMSNDLESGWWWNESEAGRGFFMEFQGDWLDVAGYMYDEQGNPVWYLTVAQMSGTNQQSFTGNWWSFANGQTLTGAWKPNTRTSDHVAPLTITFTGTETALMTLPNGRTANLKRHRF